MNFHILFSMLVVMTALGSYINYKFLKLPKTIGLTIITMLISIFIMFLMYFDKKMFLPISEILTGIDFNHTVLDVMLGYLLFAGALHVNVVDLRKQFRPILYLATFGVVSSTIMIGTLVWFVSDLIGSPISFAYCLIFGALISPTDPIAVLAVFKMTKKVPVSLKMRITGEALFNDAVGILLFVILTGIFILHESTTGAMLVVDILHEGGGGIVFGWLMGTLVTLLLRGVDDRELSILMTLAISSAGYMFSGEIGVSAPIAMVIAGLTIGSSMRKEKFTKKTIVALDNFWVLIDEMLNAFLFVLIGLEMITIHFHWVNVLIGFIAFFMILSSRYVSIAVPNLIKRLRVRKNCLKENILMTWGGIRGGISIALALSLTGNEANSIVTLTYVVVLISIIAQGGTFKMLVEKLFPAPCGK